MDFHKRGAFPRDRTRQTFRLLSDGRVRSRRAILNIPPRVRIGYPDVRPAYKCTRIRYGNVVMSGPRVRFSELRAVSDDK